MIKFDESTHIYTTVKCFQALHNIGATIFKDKYKDVDPYILRRALVWNGVHLARDDDYFGLMFNTPYLSVIKDFARNTI